MAEDQKQENVKPVRLIGIFVLLTAIMTAAGYVHYREYERRYRNEVERELSAIADLKVAELAKWRGERLADGVIINKNTELAELVARCFRNPQDKEAERRIGNLLRQYPEYYEYDQVRLLDPQGATRVSIPPGRPPVSAAVRERIPEILRSGRIAIIDFYRHDHDQRIYLSVLIPILDASAGNRAIAALSLRVDPEKYLYPYIKRWLTPSRTAETLLVRREGKDVLILNELKFERDAALRLRIPLDERDAPEVKATSDQTGIVEGLDHRGAHVIADVRAVPGSPWFLVTRMDRSEVLGPAREHMWMVVGLVAAMIFCTGASLAFIWRRQSLFLYRERYEAAEALRESEARLNKTQEVAHLGSWELDLVNNRLYWSDEAYRIFGLQPQEFGATYEAFLEAVHPDDRATVAAAYTESLRAGRDTYELEHRVVRRSTGELRTVHEKCFHVRDESGRIIRSIGMVHDITERKRLEETITQMAQHDPLTELPNRRLFREIVEHELAQARRNRYKIALLFVDLDRFKEINDTFGHEAGDELLKEVSRRLKASIRESDAAARLGGDEFTVILADILRTQDITHIAAKIMESFSRPAMIAGREIPVTASIGISIYPDDSDQIDTLCRYADIAMYHAKETGRNASSSMTRRSTCAPLSGYGWKACCGRASSRANLPCIISRR